MLSAHRQSDSGSLVLLLLLLGVVCPWIRRHQAQLQQLATPLLLLLEVLLLVVHLCQSPVGQMPVGQVVLMWQVGQSSVGQMTWITW